jgi:hypothetical protein
MGASMPPRGLVMIDIPRFWMVVSS